jgi:hypothetical protein
VERYSCIESERKAVQTEQPDAGSTVEAGELAIFSESDAPRDFRAKGNNMFMVGSASKHLHDLVLGNYSVHTNPGKLREGEQGIKQLAKRLKSEGVLNYNPSIPTPSFAS